MQIIDTEVLIGASDPQFKYHKKAVTHLISVRRSEDVYVPSAVLFECEWVLRSKQFSVDEIKRIFNNFSLIIPTQKVIPTYPSVHARAADMTAKGLSRGGYFDTLIASVAKEFNANVISTDPAFNQMGISTIW